MSLCSVSSTWVKVVHVTETYASDIRVALLSVTTTRGAVIIAKRFWVKVVQVIEINLPKLHHSRGVCAIIELDSLGTGEEEEGGVEELHRCGFCGFCFVLV